ncbi:MAG: energy transducer TonB [Terriglobia bacterium]
MYKMSSAGKIRGLLVSTICLLLLSTAALAAEGGRRVRKQVQPDYPPLALKMKVSGVVTVRATVASNGNVENATVVSGHILLKNAAADCVKQWQFEPASSDSVEIVTVSFKLP